MTQLIYIYSQVLIRRVGCPSLPPTPKLPPPGSAIFNNLAEAFCHLHLIFRIVSVRNRPCMQAR